MNLIQKIKQILGFNKTKRLEAAKETNTNQNKKTISKENILVDLNKETVEATKSEKIKEILFLNSPINILTIFSKKSVFSLFIFPLINSFK